LLEFARFCGEREALRACPRDGLRFIHMLVNRRTVAALSRCCAIGSARDGASALGLAEHGVEREDRGAGGDRGERDGEA